MKLFLIGPISHGGTLTLEKIHLNVSRFLYYAEKLEGMGYTVVHEAIAREREKERVTWEAAMKRSIIRMLSCDAVYLLPGWQRSRGARLEVFIAGEIGLPIVATPLEDREESVGESGDLRD